MKNGESGKIGLIQPRLRNVQEVITPTQRPKHITQDTSWPKNVYFTTR